MKIFVEYRKQQQKTEAHDAELVILDELGIGNKFEYDGRQYIIVDMGRSQGINYITVKDLKTGEWIYDLPSYGIYKYTRVKEII